MHLSFITQSLAGSLSSPGTIQSGSMASSPSPIQIPLACAATYRSFPSQSQRGKTIHSRLVATAAFPNATIVRIRERRSHEQIMNYACPGGTFTSTPRLYDAPSRIPLGHVCSAERYHVHDLLFYSVSHPHHQTPPLPAQTPCLSIITCKALGRCALGWEICRP